jgi:nanoRNase/pAp phosphatase (c-di-AMP/oligoRNAs hydrolase)
LRNSIKAKKKNFDAKALGHLGGLKGGHARAASLTPERQVEIAKKAALARWGK